jgi:hypothetical protein
VPTASRARHRAGQQPGFLGGDAEVEGMPASRIFTAGSVNHAWALQILIESFHGSCLSSEEHLKTPDGSPCSCLDVGHANMFQATHVPTGFFAVTTVFQRNMDKLAHEQTANRLHLVLFTGISPRLV